MFSSVCIFYFYYCSPSPRRLLINGWLFKNYLSDIEDERTKPSCNKFKAIFFFSFFFFQTKFVTQQKAKKREKIQPSLIPL